jgi:predicted NAD/FAD-dependent oxidoreductase
VHRWRYAAPAQPAAAGASAAWWNADLGLGVCGDHLGDGGAEAAWRSGRELAGLLLASKVEGVVERPPALHR